MTDVLLQGWKGQLDAALEIYTEWARGNAACRSSRVLEHRHELADDRELLVVQQESRTEDTLHATRAAVEEGIEEAMA